MNNAEFVLLLKHAAECKTLYVKGGFGLTLNSKGKARAINSYEYNKKRANKINAMPNDSFGFDCCGLGKGIIWGFTGDAKKVYGGAVYKSNGLDDVSELGLINLCSDVSENMENIIPGELLYMKGHCGYYLGDSMVAESTPAGPHGYDGVQITALNFRKWLKHGKLTPYITYGESHIIKHIIARPTIKNGSYGMQVDFLQQNLNTLGESLDVDGQCGPLTTEAIKRFQKKYNLSVDGIYGPRSYQKMREVLNDY